MTNKVKHTLHRRSSVNTPKEIKIERGQLVVQNPKAPKQEDIEFGEIAINYGKNSESLFIKNSNNEIIRINSLSNVKYDGKVDASLNKYLDDRYVKRSGDTIYGNVIIKGEEGYEDNPKFKYEGLDFDVKADETKMSGTNLNVKYNNVNISGNTTLNDNLTVNGETNLNNTNVNGDLSVSGNLNLNENSTINGKLSNNLVLNSGSTKEFSTETFDNTKKVNVNIPTNTSHLNLDTFGDELSLSDKFVSSVYPQINEKDLFKQTEPNSTIDVAINNVDSNVVTLTNEILKNEEVVAGAITNIKDTIGISGEKIEYVKNKGSKYISGATSFNEADICLNNAINNEEIERTKGDSDNAELINNEKVRSEGVENKLREDLGENDSKGGNAFSRINDLENKVGDTNVTTQITNAINKLNDTDSSELGKYVSEVNQANGIVTSSTKVSLVNSGDKVLSLKDGSAQSTINLVKVTGETLGVNVKEAYKLVGIDGQTALGETINVYKDSAISKVELGKDDATVNTETGVLDEPGLGEDALLIVYHKEDGTYELVKIPVADFLRESEFKNGLQVVGGEVSVLKDSASEDFLSVSDKGIKLSGVQTAIDTAKTTVAKNSTENTNAHLVLSEKILDTNKEYTIGLKDVASELTVNDLKAKLGNTDDTADTNPSTAFGRIQNLENSLGEGGNVSSQINNAINSLNSEISGNQNKYISNIKIEKGKITNSESISFESALSTESENAPQTKVVDAAIKKATVTVNAKGDGRVRVAVVDNGVGGVNGKTITITEDDIAQKTVLDAEIKRSTEKENALNTAITSETATRKAVTGVNGDKCTYSGTNYLNDQTSLHAADVVLDGKIKVNADSITNLTNKVNVNETNITNLTSKVNVNEKNITKLTSDLNSIKNEGALDNRYVNISGDTMTGSLTVNGEITATGGIFSSDRRLKSDITPINSNDIKSVKNIELKSYRFTNDKTNRERYGVIAQDLEENHLSNLVVEAEGKKGVDYVSFLILKIAQLEKEIDELKNR